MGKYFKWKVLLIVLVVAFSIWKVYPPQENINLGLDLQGGMQLLLEVDIEKIPEEGREDATERVVEIIRNRIDELGVREPVISKQGRNQVVVQLPGVTDRERAKDIVGRTAHLEFKLVSEDPDLIKQAEDGTVPAGYDYSGVQDPMGQSDLLLVSVPVLTGDHLTNAWVGFGQMGEANVEIQFDKEGGKLFDQVTFQNVGKRLAIVLDGKIHSAPVIRDRIPNGKGVISGNFTPEEANDLSLILRAGALPAPVNIIEERTVGPTLGRDSIDKGVKAGMAGILLTLLFMPFYYRLPGVIANVGLVVYAIMICGLMALLGSSLTLPGIAGFILSIGMAVDANILISERMREELDSGKTPRAAISAGYHRAFSAILDSNVAIFITALILFIMGTGPVKGFAVTLGLGQIASMFSSLTVTRVCFDYLAYRNPNLNLKMARWFATPNYKFLKGRLFAYGFSVLTLVIGILSFAMRGNENFGVEFTGGTLVQVAFKTPVDTETFREALSQDGRESPSLQHFGDPSDNQFIVRVRQQDTKAIEAAAKAVGGEGGYQILRVDQVGPTVSGDLTKKALLALFWTSIGILLYVGYRFKWRFAMAAVIAVIHDVLFTFGVYALSGREISVTTVAALLTIMGYSVNDTIVIFDRVRENLRGAVRKKSFKEIVELSINQMFVRTQFTSLNVFFGALALFLFGGGGVNDFAFTLCVGFAVGVYTTLFLAPAILVDASAGKA